MNLFSIFCRFGVTEEMLKPFLEGLSLQKVLDDKRMFLVDHKILTDLPCRKGFTVSVYISVCITAITVNSDASLIILYRETIRIQDRKISCTQLVKILDTDLKKKKLHISFLIYPSHKVVHFTAGLSRMTVKKIATK